MSLSLLYQNSNLKTKVQNERGKILKKNKTGGQGTEPGLTLFRISSSCLVVNAFTIFFLRSMLRRRRAEANRLIDYSNGVAGIIRM